MSKSTHPIARWHSIAQRQDSAALETLLADDVVFHSPVVHTPQEGKAITSKYLDAAFTVLFNESFEYVREIVGDNDAALEFTVELDGVSVNGVDLIRWNETGQITDFKVMIRPLKAIGAVQKLMAAQLSV